MSVCVSSTPVFATLEKKKRKREGYVCVCVALRSFGEKGYTGVRFTWENDLSDLFYFIFSSFFFKFYLTFFCSVFPDAQLMQIILDPVFAKALIFRARVTYHECRASILEAKN